MGDGAQRLGLSGDVDVATFRDLLDGKMPDGSQIHNAAEGRRGGTDFTFSAPKSVSMQTLIGGDDRLIAAHENAVARTLEYAEGLAAYRITEKGVTQREASGNLIIAAFRHDLSRALDPNLHTHAVVLNATQRQDGEWRALEQKDFYQQKMLMGAMYRTELALEVQKLGYQVRLTHNDGRFELAHISARQIEAFSTRSQAITASLAAKGKTREQATAHEKEVANLATRERKTEVDHQALHQIWQDKSRDLDVNYRPALFMAELGSKSYDSGARMAVSYAVEHATERQAVVNQATLVRAALEHGTGSTDLAAILAELERQKKSGELIAASECYTTHAAQRRERDMLDLVGRGRGVLPIIMSERQAEQALIRTSLNGGQHAAAVMVVSNNDRVMAIQGAAGSGKTTMLAQARELVEAQGYCVQGLAPSAAAARELGKAGISSQTLAAFQAQTQPKLNARTVLLVDEAGMVSAKDMHHVLHAAEAAQARVVLVGDVQQLKAVEAGRPFAQLQEVGIARVEMGEIQRQSDARLKQAVELAAKGYVEQSIAVLSRNVQQIEGDRERYARIAHDYAALAPVERAERLIVAGTHLARMAINDNVRVELGLAGKGIEVAILTRKDLTGAQARMSLSYQPGDVIEACKPYESLGIQRGELVRVVEAITGIVTLERGDGQQVQWRPAVQTNMMAYREASRELSIGDQVRFTANDHTREVVNGGRATVISIDFELQTVTLQKAGVGEITLDASRPLHLDHGYCSTVHSAQGQTAERILIEADTKSATANESAFYVAISRARSEATIYTDDKALLPDAMGREDIKYAALDVKKDGLEADFEL
jgi:conjugative relaxase-like TrwC/TraI family protein